MEGTVVHTDHELGPCQISPKLPDPKNDSQQLSPGDAIIPLKSCQVNLLAYPSSLASQVLCPA